ncbi:hypothetical protein OsI_22919 [Oryza sativa Indica Group]|jgi:hypothetical protein|uniref:Uncharacterized protein n=1 Tax=Oryza sativa subsp. indica TaxID=39946 RepID=B8B1Z9_ORYSI|nr:hypothetical protein OsI_22919 [Oryza sativa Indica Group]
MDEAGRELEIELASAWRRRRSGRLRARKLELELTSAWRWRHWERRSSILPTSLMGSGVMAGRLRFLRHVWGKLRILINGGRKEEEVGEGRSGSFGSTVLFVTG